MKNLSKDQQANPIGRILEALPYTESVLDVALLDTIALLLISVQQPYISNSMIMLLLIDLNKAGLIKLQELRLPGTPGVVILVNRTLNGK